MVLDQAPASVAVTVPSDVGPSNTSTVAFASAVPDRVRFASRVVLASAGASTLGVGGGWVSTVNVCVPLEPWLPAPSLCRALAVYTPSARAEAASTLHAPEASTVAVSLRFGVPVAVDPA